MPVAVERSRSGNGAHAWFFFQSPVPAGVARRMGCYLITETMARRHELRLSSYDRLFPNQDTMLRGGFDNLVALPLQPEARKAGHTLFVDDRFVPVPDQWGFLAAHPRIAASRVDELARQATERGQVIGTCVVDAGSEDDREPWRLPVVRTDRFPRIECQLPGGVRAVIAQQLFVEKAGLPSPLLNQIKRLAMFSNPEFYKKQAMRLSTATTPRLIGCAEETSVHIGLARGCRQALKDLLRHYGVELAVEDKRQDGTGLVAEFRGELLPEQQAACGEVVATITGRRMTARIDPEMVVKGGSSLSRGGCDESVHAVGLQPVATFLEPSTLCGSGQGVEGSIVDDDR